MGLPIGRCLKPVAVLVLLLFLLLFFLLFLLVALLYQFRVFLVRIALFAGLALFMRVDATLVCAFFSVSGGLFAAGLLPSEDRNRASQ